MVREDVSKSISMHLNRLFEKDRDLTLDYISVCTGVPTSTVHRIRRGESGIQTRNAIRLASFIEAKTDGNIRADRLMGAARRRNYLDAELRGEDFVGADLRDCDFRGADLRDANLSGAEIEGAQFDMTLMRGATLSGVKGTASFRGATLDEAQIENVVIDWNMTGASAKNATFKNVVFAEDVRLNGVDFSGPYSQWERITWRVIGSRSLGAKLPKIDPMQITEGFCDHLMLARGLEVAFGVDLEKDEGDQEILHFAEFMLSRESSLIRCYDGGAKRLIRAHENRIDDVVNGWGMFDWYAKERLEIALHVRQNCRTVDDYEDLRNTKFYAEDFIPGPGIRGSRFIIDKYISRAKKGDFVHQI
ncbi:MAG: hypothetical protein ACI8V2_004487 [Candidatus Latescibacterota bacterium]|jgi:hypothetical protein